MGRRGGTIDGARWAADDRARSIRASRTIIPSAATRAAGKRAMSAKRKRAVTCDPDILRVALDERYAGRERRRRSWTLSPAADQPTTWAAAACSAAASSAVR